MQDLEIVKKRELTERELDCAFEIIKLNMLALDVDVKSEDRALWGENLTRNLQNADYGFFLIFLKHEIVGFFSTINKQGSLYVPEVELAEKVKGTKVILEIIKFMYYSNNLKDINEINFSILKNNNMSNKTFSHLGGKIISQTERKFIYSLSPQDVKTYLTKWHQI